MSLPGFLVPFWFDSLFFGFRLGFQNNSENLQPFLRFPRDEFESFSSSHKKVQRLPCEILKKLLFRFASLYKYESQSFRILHVKRPSYFVDKEHHLPMLWY